MTTAKKFSATILSYAPRDDIAECQDCDWRWEFSAGNRPGRGLAAAKDHVQREGHYVVHKRVEFKELFGSPKAGPA